MKHIIYLIIYQIVNFSISSCKLIVKRLKRTYLFLQKGKA